MIAALLMAACCAQPPTTLRNVGPRLELARVLIGTHACGAPLATTACLSPDQEAMLRSVLAEAYATESRARWSRGEERRALLRRIDWLMGRISAGLPHQRECER